MDTLRPHLREMLRPYLPRVVDSFNDKQLFDKLIENKIEIMAKINGFDDFLFHNVQQRTSYFSSEIIVDAKFETMLGKTEDGSMSIVDLAKLNSYEIVK